MVSLPTPGASKNNWGDQINDFLRVSHNEDGTLKDVATEGDFLALSDAVDDVVGVAARADSRVFDVRAYGAVGNGSTDDRTAIQAAITAANTAGGGVVFFPKGTYRITSQIDLLANVTLRGAGRGWSSIVNTAGTGSVRVRGDNTVIEDVKVDSGGLNIICIRVEPLTGTAVENMAIRRCTLTGSGNSIIRVAVQVSNLEIIDNVIEDTQGISINTESTYHVYGCKIMGNIFRGITTVQPIIGFVSNGVRVYHNILIMNNIIEPGVAGQIPVELGGCDQVTVAGNSIRGGTRGISTAKCTDLIVAYNSFRDQTNYCVEIGFSSRVSIVGNTASNCYSLVHDTGNGGIVTDVAIVDNTFAGTGAASAISGGDIVKLAQGASRVLVSGNIFTDWQYARSCIRVGETLVSSDVTVSGNFFTITDANTPLATIVVRKAVRAVISRNTVNIQRDLVAGDNNLSAIVLVPDAASSRITVVDNDVIFTGTISAATGAAGIGNGDVAPAALPGMTVQRNRVVSGPYGVKLNATSVDQIVTDNDTRTCTSADFVNAAAIMKRTMANYEGTAAPSTGTWRQGDRVWNTAPTASGTLGWVCVSPGTPGTWRVFGSISA